MRRSWGAGVLGVAVAFACNFDGAGSGGDGSLETGGETDETGGTASGMDDVQPTTMPPTTDDSQTGTTGPGTITATSTDPDSTTASTTDPTGATTDAVTTSPAEDSSTGADPCANPGEETIIWVEDATVSSDMTTQQSNMLPGNPLIAFGTDAGEGTIRFEFEVACPGDFAVWGLVWDEDAGANNGADSFFVSVDGGEEIVWIYGCQTVGNPDGYWEWLDVEAWENTQCTTQKATYPLGAGAHQVTLRNRENAGFGDDIAAVAAIIVTSNPATDPDSLYDPHG